MSVGFQAVNTAVRQRMQEWCASVFKDYLEDFIANIASDDHAPSNSPLTSVKVDPMAVEQVGVEITDETFVDHALASTRGGGGVVSLVTPTQVPLRTPASA